MSVGAPPAQYVNHQLSIFGRIAAGNRIPVVTYEAGLFRCNLHRLELAVDEPHGLGKGMDGDFIEAGAVNHKRSLDAQSSKSLGNGDEKVGMRNSQQLNLRP